MPLHLTKVAYGAQSLEQLHGWFTSRGSEAQLTTRYLPKRAAEIAPGGSLYWVEILRSGADQDDYWKDHYLRSAVEVRA